MSNRVSYALAVALLLLAAVLRCVDLATLPPGFSASEINDIRIAETARQGRIEVFYDLNGQGREGLYQTFVMATTGAGGGLIGYRILSVWLGMITLALVYVLGKRLFGSLAGLAALALLAVGMFPIVLARSVTPEAMLPLFVTAVMLALALALPVYGDRPPTPPKTAAFAALGVLLGLGFYLHPVSFLMTLFSMFFIASVILTRRNLTRRMLSFTWFAVVVMIVIATPYLSSSLQRPELAAARRLLTDDPTQGFMQSFIAGFNGLFFVGDQSAAVNVPGRPLVDLFSGLLIVVGLVVTIRYWRQARCALLLIALIFLLPVTLHAPNSPNFLALSPLLPLLALFFGLGVTTLYSSFPRSTRIVAVFGLVALLAFNIVWATRDIFVNWVRLPEMQETYNARLGQLAHYIDQTAGTTPTAICTSNFRPQITPVRLTNLQQLALMMHRRDAVLRYADCGTALILTEGGDREQVILSDPSAFAGVNPYLQTWLSQGIILDAPNLPPNSVIRLNVADLLANRIGGFMSTAPATFAPEAPDGSQVVFPPVRFGGNITFLGYEQSWAPTYHPGDVIPVVTYWRVDGVLPSDLRLFTHILGDPTNLVAQSDPISVLPDTLRPRDIFIQVTYIQLPRGIPSDRYTISIGAYEDNTGTRLPVFSGEQPRGARLFLGQIEVGSQ